MRAEQANGCTLSEIAQQLNADCVATPQAGRQWWPSTVRAVLRHATNAEPNPRRNPARNRLEHP